MARLTNDDRRFIKTRLLSRAFDERKKALDAEADALHTALCVAAFGPHWDAVKDMPASFFDTNMTVTLTVQRLRRDATYPRLSGHQVHRVPANFRQSRRIGFDGVFLVNSDEAKQVPKKLADDISAWAKRRVEYGDERAKAEAQIDTLLNSITTYNKLFTVWPELRDIIPEPPSQVQRNTALIPHMPELNKVLGLPVKTPEPVAKKGVKKRVTKAA